MEDNRKAKRIALNATISIYRLDDKNDSVMQDFDVDVFDLSDMGIGFYSNISLPVGSVFKTRITTWNKEKVDAIVSVTRCVKNDNGKFAIGGQFVGMNDETKLRIGIYDIVETNS